jgi:hypothetical protein
MAIVESISIESDKDVITVTLKLDAADDLDL